jgi:hypothetical protein
VPDLAIAASPRAGGFALDISLPHSARVRWTLWTLDGQAADGHDMELAPGHYHLGRVGRLERGMYLLRLEWSGAGKSGLFTRKLPLH